MLLWAERPKTLGVYKFINNPKDAEEGIQEANFPKPHAPLCRIPGPPMENPDPDLGPLETTNFEGPKSMANLRVTTFQRIAASRRGQTTLSCKQVKPCIDVGVDQELLYMG